MDAIILHTCPLFETHSFSRWTYQLLTSFIWVPLQNFHWKSCPPFWGKKKKTFLITASCKAMEPSLSCLYVVQLCRVIPAPLGLAEALLWTSLNFNCFLCPVLFSSLFQLLIQRIHPNEHLHANFESISQRTQALISSHIASK